MFHTIQLVMLRFGFIDFDSIFRSTIRSRFDFLQPAHLCWPNSIRVWPRGNGSAAVQATHEAIPPTAAVVLRLNREDVEWAKYRSNSVALWHEAEAAKLDSATAHTNSIHCLMFNLDPEVRTSPTLVNRPTCLLAY